MRRVMFAPILFIYFATLCASNATNGVSGKDFVTEPQNDTSSSESGRGIVAVQKDGHRSVSYIIHPDNMPPPEFKPIENLPRIPSKWDPDEFIKICCSSKQSTLEEPGSITSSSESVVPSSTASSSETYTVPNLTSSSILKTIFDGSAGSTESILSSSSTVPSSPNPSLTINPLLSAQLNALAMSMRGSVLFSEKNADKVTKQSLKFKTLSQKSSSVDEYVNLTQTEDESEYSTEVPDVDTAFPLDEDLLKKITDLFETSTQSANSSLLLNFSNSVHINETSSLLEADSTENISNLSHTPRYEDNNVNAFGDVKNFLQDIAKGAGFQNAFLIDLIKNFGNLDANALKLIYRLLIEPLTNMSAETEEPEHKKRESSFYHDLPQNYYPSHFQPSSEIHGDGIDPWEPLDRSPKAPNYFARKEPVEVITAPATNNFEVVLGSSFYPPAQKLPQGLPVAQNRMGMAERHAMSASNKFLMGVEMPPPDALAALPEGSMLIHPSQVKGNPAVPKIVNGKQPVPVPPIPSFPMFNPANDNNNNNKSPLENGLAAIPDFISSLFGGNSEQPKKKTRYNRHRRPLHPPPPIFKTPQKIQNYIQMPNHQPVSYMHNSMHPEYNEQPSMLSNIPNIDLQEAFQRNQYAQSPNFPTHPEMPSRDYRQEPIINNERDRISSFDSTMGERDHYEDGSMYSRIDTVNVNRESQPFNSNSRYNKKEHSEMHQMRDHDPQTILDALNYEPRKEYHFRRGHEAKLPRKIPLHVLNQNQAKERDSKTNQYYPDSEAASSITSYVDPKFEPNEEKYSNRQYYPSDLLPSRNRYLSKEEHVSHDYDNENIYMEKEIYPDRDSNYPNYDSQDYYEDDRFKTDTNNDYIDSDSNVKDVPAKKVYVENTEHTNIDQSYIEERQKNLVRDTSTPFSNDDDVMKYTHFRDKIQYKTQSNDEYGQLEDDEYNPEYYTYPDSQAETSNIGMSVIRPNNTVDSARERYDTVLEYMYEDPMPTGYETVGSNTILTSHIGPVDIPEGTIIPKEDFENALREQKYRNKFQRPEPNDKGLRSKDHFEVELVSDFPSFDRDRESEAPSLPSLVNDHDASISHLWNNMELIPVEEDKLSFPKQTDSQIYKPTEPPPNINITEFKEKVLEVENEKSVMAYILIAACVGLAFLSIVGVLVIIRFKKTCDSRQIGGRSYLTKRSSLRELAHVEDGEDKSGHKLGSWLTGRNEQMGTGKLRSNMALPEVKEKSKTGSTRDLLSLSSSSSQNSTPMHSKRSTSSSEKDEKEENDEADSQRNTVSPHRSASWLHEEYSSSSKVGGEGKPTCKHHNSSRSTRTSDNGPSSYHYCGGRPKEYRGKKKPYLASLESEDLDRATTRTSRYQTDSEMDDTNYEMSDAREPDDVEEETRKHHRRKTTHSLNSEELGEEISRDLKVFQYGDGHKFSKNEEVSKNMDCAPMGSGFRGGAPSFSRDNVQSEVFLEFDNMLRQHTHRDHREIANTTTEILSRSRPNSPDSIDKDQPPELPPRPPKPNRLTPEQKTSPKGIKARARTPPLTEDNTGSSSDDDRLI